ncbi:MAG: Hpt domain-containing protein [Bacteriovoracaceae bacterium]|nr:Hpt domain-containing protein [Bacteriovoracaceae bacterium]
MNLINRKDLISHYEGDQKVFKLMAKTYIDIYPGQLAELNKAFMLNDFAQFERIAHAMKGGISNFFAEDLRLMALYLELAGKERKFDKEIQEKLKKFEATCLQLAEELKVLDINQEVA